MLAPRLDLGLRARVGTWRRAEAAATRQEDRRAGLAAAGLSLPLALLLAQSTGLPATAALVCATVGAGLVALLGGNAAGLSGPGVFTGVAAGIVLQRYGAAGLALTCLVCGGLQLLVGASGLARFVRVVPLAVVQAFAVSVGAWVVLQSLPLALGLGAPTELGALNALDQIAGGWTRISGAGVVMAASVGAATVIGRRYFPRIPVALPAIAVAAAVAGLAHLEVPRLPDLGFSLSASAPALPPAKLAQFAAAALTLCALASIETLMSVAAEEERTAPRRLDPDQELIGHGLANLALAFLGGVPAAASNVRDSAMQRSGARSPAAALANAAITLPLAALVVAGGHFVPLAAIAGAVVAHALPLLDPRPWRAVWRISRGQAAVLAITAVVILVRDPLSGLQTGLVSSLLLAFVRVARTRTTLHRGTGGAPHQVTFSGPLTFLSAPALERLRGELAAVDPSAGVILDIRHVVAMDLTGCRRFVALVDEIIERGGRPVVLGAAPSCRAMLLAADRRGAIAPLLAITDGEIDDVLGRPQAFELRAHVVASMQRFRDEVREHYVPLFEKLADDQKPHTLFIGCVDSRVTPALLTGTHPGELFVVRCLGAMVAPPDAGVPTSEAAAIEYAVGVLGVRNVVVCGHSRCGAVKAVSTGHVPDGLTNLQRWVAAAAPAAGDLTGVTDLDEAARRVTVRQLRNLQRFPMIEQRAASGALRLHAWFYDVGKAELFEWDEATQAFAVLGVAAPPA